MTRIPDQIYIRRPKRLPDELKFSNYALLFDGATQYVQVPACLVAASGAVEFWLYPLSWAALDRPFSDTGSYIFFQWSSAVNFRFFIYDGANKYTPVVAVNEVRWYHIIGCWDSSNVQLYVDGAFIGQTAAGAISVVTNALVIGGGIATRYPNVLIDEFRILPICPTPSQARESFRRGYARWELDARCVLRIEEASGLTALDESGYGNNGSLLPALTPPTWERIAKYELLAGKV